MSWNRARLRWTREGGTWALYAGERRASVLLVVPDDHYPGMWRVRTRDGRLSDMANLSWAKDAGVSIALRALNSELEIRGNGRRPARFPGEAGTSPHGNGDAAAAPDAADDE